MKAVILAAGQGSRMLPLTENRSKALLKVGSDTLLTRLRMQLLERGVTDIIVVAGYLKEQIYQELTLHPLPGQKCTVLENTNYLKDTNIGSALIALEAIENSFYLFEADILFSDTTIQDIINPCWEGQSVWFTNGSFQPHHYGGILKSNLQGQVEHIDIVKRYDSSRHQSYKKLLGVMRIDKKQLPLFRNLVKQSIQDKRDSYYLTPWIENLADLPCIEGDLSNHQAYSFNTPAEYEKAVHTILGPTTTQYVLVPTENLKHIEQYDKERVQWLTEKISREGKWTIPLKIEKDHCLVLDGQHRMEVAKNLKLKKVPCQVFDYKEVELWSLREDEKVSRDLVKERSLNGDIYPFKTVKHKFPITAFCEIDLSTLK